MKPASSALIAYLNSARANPDVPLIMADTFTFTLLSGLILCYTNVDVTFAYGGNTYLANSIRVDGLKYKAALGLEVDQQQMTVAALATDTITSGAPFLQALRDGSFDGCEIVRFRIFFSDRIGGTAIGSVLLFKGRLGVVEEIGRTSAKLTVNSDLTLLDIDMPRNVYQPTWVGRELLHSMSSDENPIGADRPVVICSRRKARPGSAATVSRTGILPSAIAAHSCRFASASTIPVSTTQRSATPIGCHSGT